MNENTEAAVETTITPDDPFAGTNTLPGLEHLGRAIVDSQGVPSGSPANFEQLRGQEFPLGHAGRATAHSAEQFLAEHRQAMLQEHAAVDASDDEHS